MTTPNASRSSYVGMVLHEMCGEENRSVYELARDMIANGFPSYEFSNFPSGTTLDIAWLAKALTDIMAAQVDDPWPFDPRTNEFIDAAALCLPLHHTMGCLQFALSIDELRRHQPLSPPSPSPGP